MAFNTWRIQQHLAVIRFREPAARSNGTDRACRILKDDRTWTLYIPMFVMLAVTFTALVQKTIALVRNVSAGTATFLVDGLQLIVAILLMILGALVAYHCLSKLFTAKKEEA